MGKGAILLAVLMAVGLSTTADAAKRKAAPAPKMSAQDQSFEFMRVMFMPWEIQSAAPAKAKPMKMKKKSAKKMGKKMKKAA